MRFGKKEKTSQDIQNTFLECKLTDAMQTCLKFLQEKSCHVIILSDANSIFIDNILKGSSAEKLVKKIVTNPAEFDPKGFLRISPYHANEDVCLRCPKNLCKGIALASELLDLDDHVRLSSSTSLIGTANLLTESPSLSSSLSITSSIQMAIGNSTTSTKYSTIIYIGDGKNDFCPCRQLRDNDYILARKKYGLHNLLSQENSQIKAHVFPWENGWDVYQILQQIFH